jgi:YVTN family beta-propeller protein
MLVRSVYNSGCSRMWWTIASAVVLAVLPVMSGTSVAAAAASPKAYVGLFQDNAVAVLDAGSGRLLRTIPVAAGPHGLVITKDGRQVYVSSDGSSVVSVIDTDSDRVSRTIEVGKEPHGLALTPDGRLLLVAVNGADRVALVETATGAVTATVSVGKPHTISVRPDGKLAYVASQEPSRFALAVIDLDARAVVRTIALDKPPRDLEFGYDGKALYFTKAGVNAVQVLDPTSEAIVEIPTGVSPHYANVFRGMTLGLAVVQGSGELLLFDPATNRPVRSIAVGKQPHWVAVSGDGKTAYVTNEGSNDVSIVELATGKTATTDAGKAPRKIVVQAAAMAAEAGAKVSIANFQFVPAVVTIAPGGSVTWSNDDGALHALAFGDGSPGASSLAPGTTFSRVFERRGTYEYACSFHRYMTARVVVR